MTIEQQIVFIEEVMERVKQALARTRRSDKKAQLQYVLDSYDAVLRTLTAVSLAPDDDVIRRAMALDWNRLDTAAFLKDNFKLVLHNNLLKQQNSELSERLSYYETDRKNVG